jgi:hypothetical protein
MAIRSSSKVGATAGVMLTLIAAVPAVALASSGSSSGSTMAPGDSLNVSCPTHLRVVSRTANGISLKCDPTAVTTAPSTTTPPTTTPPTTTPPTTTPPTTTPPTTTPPTTTPPAQLTSSSAVSSDPIQVFGHSLPSSTVATSDSSTIVANFVKGYQTNYGTVGLNAGGWGMPTYTVPANQPLVGMQVASGCYDFTGGTPSGIGGGTTGTEVPIPPNVGLNGLGDNPLVIWQPSTNTEWEFWIAQPSGSGYSACWGGKITNASTSNGVFPNGYGMSASGISYLGTEITSADIASGAINHMIDIIVPGNFCNAGIAPADRTDCGSNPGSPSEGTILRFPANVPMPSGLAPFAQMVFTAIQKYGMIVIDQGGATVLSAQFEPNGGPITSSLGGQQPYQVVANLPWSQMQTVQYPIAAG